MDNIILQIIVTSCLITGVITGEAVSNKLFGYSKKWYLNIIEIFLFVTILTIMFSNTTINPTNPVVPFLANFFLGLAAITTTRGITSGVGFFSKRIKNKYFLAKNINEDVIIIGLTRNLLNKGLSKETIKEVLENSGLNRQKAKKTLRNINIEEEEVIGTEQN